MARDSRIDTIRGFAMVTIIINHFSFLSAELGMTGPQIPTTTTFSVSSAAEIFVALSGYMVGMVYVNKPNATTLLIARAAKLYAWNFALFVTAALLTLVTDQRFNAVAHFTPLTSDPIQATTYFLIMTYGPFLLIILHLYVMLLVVSPMAVWLIRRSPLFLVIVSVTVYMGFQVCVRFYPELGGSPNPLEKSPWGFHPLAWQVIFFVAMAGGSVRLHDRAFAILEKQRWIFWVSLVLFISIGTLKTFLDIPRIPLTDHGTLGPARAAHAILVVLLYAGVVTVLKSHLDSLLFRSFALIGRHSLNAFLFSTVATFIGLYIWQQLGLGWLGYMIITVLLIVATWGAAKHWDKRKFAQALGSESINGIPLGARV